MYIQQLYTTCLAEAAYYIESNGEAAIIDPLRETEPYMDLAKARNAKIKYVFETHFHADFVSGHIDLARKTNSTIVYGPKAKPDYDAYIAKDNEKFTLGDLTIKVLHTPGHTPESASYLLLDQDNKEYAVFTGDTLFVGDVGRPDLAVKSDLTQYDLAGMLYDSLNNKIKTLADETIVYPAHGAGSACGKNIGKETFSTIGHQKKFNYALQEMSKQEFIKAVTEGLSAPPKYFFHDAAINQKGYQSIDEVMEKNTNELTVEDFEKAMKIQNVQVLDTRNPEEFELGFIPGSINIGLNGQYGPWVGALLDPKNPLLLIASKGKEQEAVLRLARVGYENVSGYLKDGMQAWTGAGKKTDTVESFEAEEFVKKAKAGEAVLDVRKPGEHASGVIPGAQLIDLSVLNENLDKLDKQKHYFVHCAGGYRSMIAVSLLKKMGYENLTNVLGGMAKIKELGTKLALPEGNPMRSL
ncbi:MAG: MBL fold metallo-hydrolase [Bacteroidetes bacterium]|nr:MBL fold metallo-hydrolase [Bacteroidota bacterium]HET6244266.1 MBL fold metallo-hydrolase [Bacteroidia bacterium]